VGTPDKNVTQNTTRVITTSEKRPLTLERFLEKNGFGGGGCPLEWWQWARDHQHWDLDRTQKVWDTFRDYWKAQRGQRGVKADWEATWRNWCRRESSFQKQAPLAKGEVRVREATPEGIAEGKLRAEFIRLSKQSENLRKSEAEIWALVRAAKQWLKAEWRPCPIYPNLRAVERSHPRGVAKWGQAAH
jgi:hypothetical protein